MSQLSKTNIDTEEKATEQRISIEAKQLSHTEEYLPAHVTDSSQDKRILRRVDWHVLPWLAILYAWSLIDRTNIANARIEGMQAELGLSIGARYSIALLIFFPFYFVSTGPFFAESD